MCLGVPGKVVKKWRDEKSGIMMAQVDFAGIKKDVCIQLNEDAEIGEYLMIHVGFAISKINAEEAEKTLALIQSMGELEEELGVAGESA